MLSETKESEYRNAADGLRREADQARLQAEEAAAAA